MFATSNQVSILSVTKLNRFAKRVLESEIGLVWVTGEISNFVKAASGHWYFTLKDNSAQIRSAMFKGANQRINFIPKQGDKVLVRASLSIYEPRGDYQLIIQHMEPEGIGQLKQEFEALKLKLSEEGLFANENKKPIPQKIKTIGVVTSPSGAAIHDILHVLARRNPAIQVILYPASVQGNLAAGEIVRQIQTANRRNEVEVLIVGRGGGSLEDLWPFNEEPVARAIFASNLPVVSAVGHEIDVTISDFVADQRAPTPSAAAELLSSDMKVIVDGVHQLTRRLTKAFLQRLKQLEHQQALAKQQLNFNHPSSLITQQNQKLDALQLRLFNQHPNTQIQQQGRMLAQLKQRLARAMSQHMQQAKYQQQNWQQRCFKVSPMHTIKHFQNQTASFQKQLENEIADRLKINHQLLASKAALLDSVSPLATLKRGYSISFHEGEIVKKADSVEVGQTLVTRVFDGEITSQVTLIEKK
ncbi:exodeoxyribonuclease VII large subunit [Glaciecola sp. 1036]|uniref:exodeoxyribonuclease VII large subunit n=1 Tax=Alteromonadaceae TaxID=72275 RepID=UPI003D009BF4